MVRLTTQPVGLVATDLDGTIVRTDGTLSDRTVAAITRAEAAGVPVVFVTGRPPRWMAPVAQRTGHQGLAICGNGAVVYDLHAERIVERYPLTGEVTSELVETIRAAIPGVAFAVETDGGFAHEDGYVARYPPAVLLAGGVTAAMEGPVLKLLVRHEDRVSDDLLAAAREAVGDLAVVTHSTPDGSALLEISAAGVSKATTLARLCDRRGVVAEQVVAFGDMPNDLPMLAWAGTSYAVANAHPEVLAAVDHVTASNDDDGVAQVIEALL